MAEIAANAKPADSAEEKFERVRDLVGKPESNLESAFALARAALAAKRWDVAKAALESQIAEQPQARICGLMARIEDAQGEKGRSREWLARALHAPRDPIWVSDGVAAARWTPVSPVTGEIVPCVWKPPFEQPAGTPWQLDSASETPLLETAKPKPTKIETQRAPDDPGID